MKRSTFLVLTLAAVAVLALTPAIHACTDLVSDEQATRADTTDAVTTVLAATAAETSAPASTGAGPPPTPAVTAESPPTPPSSESPAEASTTTSEEETVPPTDGIAVDLHPMVTAVDPGIIIEALRNRYEETDSRIGWGGSWSTLVGAECSGGSIRCCSDRDLGAITVRFSGVSIDIIGLRSDFAGSAYVRLDDGPPETVSWLGTGLMYQETVWSSGPIASGEHVLTIHVREGQINLDAVDVFGQLL